MSFLTALSLPRRADAKQSDYDHNVRYEICAASERAKVLLQTAQQVNDQLHTVRTLRRQRSSNLSESGKEWIDDAISHTSIAVSTTAHLAEPVPEHASGRRRRLPEASFLRHLRHLISDSSQVTAQLAQLSIASQSLNTAMSILLTCESHKSNNTMEVTETGQSPALEASLQELSELMNRRRKVNAAPIDYSLLPSSKFPISANEDFASQATTTVAREGNPVKGSTGDVFDTFLIDHKLVLTIEAVEKWRMAAEEALETATQKSSVDEHKDQHSDVQPSFSDLCHTSPLPLSRMNYDRPPADRASIPRRKPVSSQQSPQFRDPIKRASVSSQSKHLDPPNDPSLRQSYEKEAVFPDQSAEAWKMPRREEANTTAMLGRNGDATFSPYSISSDFPASKNHSSVSMSTMASQPYCRSRGRAWLERRADSLE
jgi:hypothetical protein